MAKRKNRLKFDTEKITISYNTAKKNYTKKLFHDLNNNKHFNKLDIKVKEEIKFYIKKDFIKFLIDRKDKDTLIFTEWLEKKYPLALMAKSNNVYQIPILKEDKSRGGDGDKNKFKYRIVGSGNPEKFFISGDKEKYPRSNNKYGFMLHVNIFGRK